MQSIKNQRGPEFTWHRFAKHAFIGATIGMFGAGVASAQEHQCVSQGTSFSCETKRGGAVVCTPERGTGKVQIAELAACVDRNNGTGQNPLVTVAAFGGGSAPTDRYRDWNGGTAFTTHKLDELQKELGGAPLYFAVAQGRTPSSRGSVDPGRATVVATKPVRQPKQLSSLHANDTLLVAAGGGAHGQLISANAVEDAKRGGAGGYVDGWLGSPCPYTAGGVCAAGAPGASAAAVPGGAGGAESRNTPFVGYSENGVERTLAGRYAWGGHGGAGHPQGNGGLAAKGADYVAAAGGGGGGSFARRSTRATPDDLEFFLLQEPGVQVVFHPSARRSEIKWQHATFTGDGVGYHDIKTMKDKTTISVLVDDPGAPHANIDLDGLVLVDRSRNGERRIEPYRITDVSNLGDDFVTTDRSRVFYLVYDEDGQWVGRGVARAAASLRLDESLKLFFRYDDLTGASGRMAVFAGADAPRGRRVARAR